MSQTRLDDLSVVQPGISDKDGCPVLRRIKSFLTQAGVAATLEFTFRDRQGVALDLTPPTRESESASESASETALEDQVLLRIQEITALGSDACDYPVVPAEGTIVDAANGVVRAKLPKAVRDQSAIYRLSWGFLRDAELKVAQEGLLSVERSLFSRSDRGDGPPTVNEIRMQLADSDPNENNLLDAVEFDDEQILTALLKPIQYFNEVPPPLSVRYDTRDFPWKSHWIDAAIGYLHEIAAAKYRRNALAVNAGGMNINDMQKEEPYLAFANSRLEAWKSFVATKKLELNMREACGFVGSTYGRTRR